MLHCCIKHSGFSVLTHTLSEEERIYVLAKRDPGYMYNGATRASKRHFERRKKTALGPQEQAETSLKI